MEEAALAYAREYSKREPLLVNRRGDRTGLMHWRVQEARQNSGLTAEAFSSEPPMTKEEALRLAQEEGLSLLTSKDNATGYQCVAWQPNGTARAVSKGKLLGTFSGAPEAALAYSRHLGPEGCAAAAAAAAATAASKSIMTEEEAQRLAASEGLVLLTADNPTGYKGVYESQGKFTARLILTRGRGGKRQHLGSFSSAVEAALAYARHLGPEGCAAAVAAAADATTAAASAPMTEAEVDEADSEVLFP